MKIPTIFVIGDSISLHYGPFLQQFIRGVFSYARKEGPQGANGGDSSMVLAYLQTLAERPDFRPDLLLVNCGLHDIKTDPATGRKQVPLADYRKNIEEIVALCRRMEVRLVWIRTTPCDEAVHNRRPGMPFHRFACDCLAYNAAADDIMAAAGVPEIDLFTFTVNLGPDLYCDHVHFHTHIREKQAACIAGWLFRDVLR